MDRWAWLAKVHRHTQDRTSLKRLSTIEEKAMATHSSTLAWGIPWMEKTGRLQSMGSLSQTRLSDFTFTFHFHALVKEMATHSSVLAWRIPGMGEPGGLPSTGSHRVRHNWSDLAAAAELLKWRYLIEKRLQCTFWHSVAKSRLTLCNPKDWSTTGFPVLHYLPEFAQTHVYWVNDRNQASHSLSMYLMIHKF